MNKFSERLKELRTQNGLTQCRVSAYLNITQPSYTRYESGKAEPSIDTLIRLADLFDVSLDELVGRKDF